MTDLASHAVPVVRRGFLARVSSIAAIGGLLYGFDMGIIAAAIIFVQRTFALSTGMEELVVSIVLIGAMAGAIAGGAISDRIGRRATLLWAGAIFLTGSILAPLAPNVGTLLVARAILGVAIGFTSVTAPVYVSELAPPQSRGMLIGLYQLALTVGIALSDLVGYWLAADGAWRIMFGLAALPAALFLGAILTVPESPRWLLSHGRAKEADIVLHHYTDDQGAAQVLSDIRTALAMPVEQRWSALWSPSVRGALFTGIGLTVLQQATGINVVIYYGPRIFELAGSTSHASAILATFVVAVVNVLATIVALVLVDRVGRKPLLYAGVSGMTVALFALSFAFGNVCGIEPGDGRHRHHLPDDLHRLFRVQPGSDCLDSGIGDLPAARSGTGRCCRNPVLGNCELRHFSDVSFADQGSRSRRDIRDLRCPQRCDAGLHPLRHTRDARARSREHQRPSVGAGNFRGLTSYAIPTRDSAVSSASATAPIN